MLDTVSYKVHSFLLTRRGEQEYMTFVNLINFEVWHTGTLLILSYGDQG